MGGHCLSVECRREIDGSQEAAGSPRPLMMTTRETFSGFSDTLLGKNVYEIGASGLLGIVRKAGGMDDIVCKILVLSTGISVNMCDQGLWTYLIVI